MLNGELTILDVEASRLRHHAQSIPSYLSCPGAFWRYNFCGKDFGLRLCVGEMMETYFAFQCQPNQQYAFVVGTGKPPQPPGLVLEFHDQPANRILLEIMGLTPQQLAQLKQLLNSMPQIP